MTDADLLGRNKDLVRRGIDVLWNRADGTQVDCYIHENFVRHHERNQDQDLHGRDGFRAWLAAAHVALPGLRLEIVRMFGENDRIMVHLSGQATHGGPLKGVAATGTALTWTATAIVRVADGLVTECWCIVDTLGLLQQVGAVRRIG